MKCPFILCVIMVFTLAGFGMPASAKATAGKCHYHQQQVDRYTQLRRAGGTGQQMNWWQRQRRFHQEALRNCQQTAATPVRTVSGASDKGHVQRHSVEPSPRKSQTADPQSPAQHITHIRTLNECIKPGNLIDNEVSECLQGIREADWQSGGRQER